MNQTKLKNFIEKHNTPEIEVKKSRWNDVNSTRNYEKDYRE